MTRAPVRYGSAVEQPIADEEQVHRDLIDTMRGIEETTSRDYGHAVRSVHAKSHGLMEGELTVADGLPPELAQGLFAKPGRYKVVMRLSTNPGDILDDSVSAPRGMAVKVLGVEGERLPDSAGETTQNFLLVNAPAFAAKDAEAFLGSLKQLAATTDKAQWAKKLLSATLRGVENVLEAAGTKSAMISTMGGAPLTHPLGDSYYSQVPFRHGDFIAKYALVPVSPNLTELTGDRVSVAGRPDALREAVRGVLIEQGGAWELRVQLCTGLEKMPVEDASVKWDEKESPYRAVGRVTVAPQIAWSPERAGVVDDRMYFSPWHGLAAHQPLGSVNRARRRAYELSAGYRARFNGCPVHEPRALDALPAGTMSVPEESSMGARRAAGAVLGGLAAGIGLSAAMLLGEKIAGKPSELIELERKAAVKIGVETRRGDAPATVAEQLVTHGGHLALSALAGLAYAAAVDEDSDSVTTGAAFGLTFFVAAYGVTGPLLGVTPPPWREQPMRAVQHPVVHALFGIAAALAARASRDQPAPAGR